MNWIEARTTTKMKSEKIQSWTRLDSIFIKNKIVLFSKKKNKQNI